MSSKKYGGRFHKGITSLRVPEGVQSSALSLYLEALDCPRALTVAILLREGEHQQLAELGFDPLHYNSLVELRDSYAATKFLSKFEGLTLDVDLDVVAKEKFMKFELLCRSTNARFRNLELDPLFKGKAVWLHNAVIRKISKILGEFSCDEVFERPDWGPGASTLIKRRDASPAKKFRCEIGITRDLYDLLPSRAFEEYYPLWAKQLAEAGFPSFQVGNKVITVPKDATTNRVIAVEPGINIWFQKAIGEMIGRRLRRWGVDLRWQSRNQQLAKKGSQSQTLTTVDLSSASDSIARLVVEELLPPRWHALLDAARSHFGTLDGSLLKWEKFSSMGNGFTFQLESLIFYAVAVCCAEYHHLDQSEVSAYGDDVVLPTACLETFTEMLSFYGFVLNTKKSHSGSLFRESCGAHYYSGIDVKPIYLKSRLSSVPAIYRLANAIRRQAHRHNAKFGCDARFRRVFEHLVHAVPRSLRIWIPEDLGDGGFIGNFDEATPSRAKHGIEGYRVSHVMEVSKTHQDETVGYLLAALWQLRANGDLDFGFRQALARTMLEDPKGLPPEGPTTLKAITNWLRPGRVHLIDRKVGEVEPQPRVELNAVPLSGRTVYRKVNSVVSQWYDLGPWQ